MVRLLRVALLEPEIPGNTGNIIRLAANTGIELHLVGPLGFELDDRRLRRAGLDYHEWAGIVRHRDLGALRAAIGPARVLGFSTRGVRSYAEQRFAPGDVLLFGPETRGLPEEVLAGLGRENVLRIPQRSWSRSLNLSNAVAVAVYEAWRQLGFE
jgi:tRNA (cytidine/uridine-2'-O-)-methyltransferase